MSGVGEGGRGEHASLCGVIPHCTVSLMLAVQCYLPAADCVGETGVMLTRCICCIALNVRYNQPGANH